VAENDIQPKKIGILTL